MAQGTLALFDEFAESIADGRIDLDTQTFKMALITLQVGGTPAISKTTPVPCWSANGTTDLSASEVNGGASGGGYTADGEAMGSVTWVNTTGTSAFDSAAVPWTSSASGDPTDIKTAVIYENTTATKTCIGFIDLTSDGTTAISLLSGNITVTPNATGWFTVTNP